MVTRALLVDSNTHICEDEIVFSDIEKQELAQLCRERGAIYVEAFCPICTKRVIIKVTFTYHDTERPISDNN